MKNNLLWICREEQFMLLCEVLFEVKQEEVKQGKKISRLRNLYIFIKDISSI